MTVTAEKARTGNDELAPPPARMTLRLASMLLFEGGTVDVESMTDAVLAVGGGSRRRTPFGLMREAMAPLVRDNVAVLVDGTWYAPSLADLAAWVADGFEAREDAGSATDPIVPAIPAPRGRRAA